MGVVLKKAVKLKPPLEDEEQAAVFDWVRASVGRHPELAFCYHVPNGGGRSQYEGKMFKRLGVLPGVPDIHLPVGRKGFLGLYIELKRIGGKVSEEQERFGRFVIGQGYMWCVCYGADEAIATLKNYLN